MQSSAQKTKQQKHHNDKSPSEAAPFSLPFKKAAPASITSDENDPDSRHECAICINWLNEPVLTKCGHRFCKSCLDEWLGNHNQCCPLDNKVLSIEKDIFPDNFTLREIEQMKLKCPNSPLGCSVIASPIEVDRHLPTCPYRNKEEKCPFASIKCDFVGRPETNALEEHLKDDMPHHMQLMLQAFQKTAIATWNPQKHLHHQQQAAQSNGMLPPPPPQYANEADGQVIQALHQRIVVLEQRNREQDIKVENLTKQLTVMRHQVDPRYSNGTIVWQLQNFSALVERLRSNAANQEYSPEFYTSPYGYKFCGRLNIQPKTDHSLSLHVHLMQSENDIHIDWPFKGRIKLCIVHPSDDSLSHHDTIMTKPNILAFFKPRERISTRGFGFVEYANIKDMLRKGYCEGDRLMIKIEINIV